MRKWTITWFVSISASIVFACLGDLDVAFNWVILSFIAVIGDDIAKCNRT